MTKNKDDDKDNEPMSSDETDTESNYSKQQQQFKKTLKLCILRSKDVFMRVQHI